jgi:hypothetical protein
MTTKNVSKEVNFSHAVNRFLAPLIPGTDEKTQRGEMNVRGRCRRHHENCALPTKFFA